MRIRRFRPIRLLVLPAMATLYLLGASAIAQGMTGQNRSPAQDNDTTQQELSSFGQFLHSHPKLADQIHKDPSLVNSDEFVKDHPVLQNYLRDHPTIRQEIKEKPNAFIERETLHERHADNRSAGGRYGDADRDRDGDHEALHRQFGQFLDGHSSVTQKLSKDPSLVKNQEFMENQPDLKEFLSSHPDLQQQLMKDPQGFLNSSQKVNSGPNNGGTVKSRTPTAAPAADPKPKQ